jgi:hypothetical protein
MGYQRSLYQIIFQVQIELTLFGDNQLQEIQDILSIQLTGISR